MNRKVLLIFIIFAFFNLSATDPGKLNVFSDNFIIKQMKKFKMNEIYKSKVVLLLVIVFFISNFLLANPVKVVNDNSHSGFGYYNTCPESPNGQKIAYTKMLGYSSSNRDAVYPAELWICNRDLTNHEKIFYLSGCGNHNFSFNLWIDNNTIALLVENEASGGYDNVYIIDVNTKSVKYGPYSCSSIAHNVVNNKLLIYIKTGEVGIYAIDLTNGNVSLVISKNDIGAAFNSEFGGSSDVSTWSLGHFQLSDDGTLVAIKVKTGSPESNKYLVTCNINGDDLLNFGPKPMHYFWYDHNTIAGHDNQVADGINNNKQMRRWDRSHNFIETLAGSGNHTAMSFDKQWYASESWYNSSPVLLKVYQKGSKNANATLDLGPYTNTVWTLGNHINPAFSRDGQRIYFTKPINNSGKAYAYYWDIHSNIEDDTELPSVPQDLKASTVSNNSWIDLNWSPSTDNVGVAEYNIIRNDVLIDVTSDTSYLDTGLLPGTTHTYNVAAIDVAGNTSENSASASATTLATDGPTIHSFSSSQGPNVPVNLFDGITADWSRWSAKNFPQWVIIDYGQTIPITGVRLWTGQQMAYRYTIEASNSPDSGYTTIVDRSQNTNSVQPISNNFTAVNARYLKITVTGAHGYTGTWCHLTEFVVIFNNIIQAVKQGERSLPQTFSLHQNYPNPFNPETSIAFSLPNSSKVQLVVYNLLGRKIKTLVNRTVAQGNHCVKWDGTNAHGHSVPGGVYFCKLKASNEVQVNKMLFIK